MGNLSFCKRLVFGISSASEIYQHLIQQMLQGCEGARNISDDIVIHGKNHKEHNMRLEKVLQCLRDKGLTLNRSKCRFGLSELVSVGHVVSDQGVNADAAKVSAVQNAAALTNPAGSRELLLEIHTRFFNNCRTTSCTHQEAITVELGYITETSI